MKLHWLLFGLLVALCVVVGAAFVIEDVPPGGGHGYAHGEFPSMDTGGPGEPRHAPILWLACAALRNIRNLTVTSAELTEAPGGRSHCYVKGILPPAIHFHVQLPFPRSWNGRFLQWGDGGKDGDLDFADHRVTEGYAVANSNTGLMAVRHR